jgi:hypothetical protein
MTKQTKGELIVNPIPEEWMESVRSRRLSGPPPHDPLDWLGPEMYQIADDLALGFDQSETLWSALATVLERMSNEELSAGYRAIEAGSQGWGISCFYVDSGGLIFEWAGYPLLISNVALL